jgi:hypothetical protein
VEGDVDARLYGRLINRESCHIQICHNRANVICVIKLLDRTDFTGHIGIIDNDFSTILDERIESENLLRTDQNDLESMIFYSDTFDRFIAEFGSKEKVFSLQASKKLSLREILIQSASIVGTLVVLSKINGWNLNFEEMTFRFSGRNDIDIDIDRQIDHLRGRSTGTTMPSVSEVKASITSIRQKYPTLLLHTRGCDLCEVLAKGVHDVFGRNHHMLARGGRAVEEVIRAAYSRENFEKTELYSAIRAWEAKRELFVVLA